MSTKKTDKFNGNNSHLSWMTERWKVEAVVLVIFTLFMLFFLTVVSLFKADKPIDAPTIGDLNVMVADKADGEVVEIDSEEGRNQIANLVSKQLEYMKNQTVYIPFNNNSGVKEAEIRNPDGECFYIAAWPQGVEARVTLKDGAVYSTDFKTTHRGEATSMIDQIGLLVDNARDTSNYKVTATKYANESPVWKFELNGWDEVLSIYNISEEYREILKKNMAQQLGYMDLNEKDLNSLDVAVEITLRLDDKNNMLCSAEIKVPNTETLINMYNINEYYILDDNWKLVSKLATADLDKSSDGWIAEQIKVEYDAVDKMLEHFSKDHGLEYK